MSATFYVCPHGVDIQTTVSFEPVAGRFIVRARQAFCERCFREKMERLGPEFEAVLFDNLWELYAR